jgi:hypothetical protein
MDAIPVMVPAGHECGAGGTADCAGDIAVGEPDTGGREGIEVWGGHVFAALNSAISVSHVVGNNENDVGSGVGERGEQAGENGEEEGG